MVFSFLSPLLSTLCGLPNQAAGVYLPLSLVHLRPVFHADSKGALRLQRERERKVAAGACSPSDDKRLLENFFFAALRFAAASGSTIESKTKKQFPIFFAASSPSLSNRPAQRLAQFARLPWRVVEEGILRRWRLRGTGKKNLISQIKEPLFFLLLQSSLTQSSLSSSSLLFV